MDTCINITNPASLVYINGRPKKKSKNVAFVSNTQEDEDQDEKDTEKSLSNTIVYIERKFKRALKNLDKNWRTNLSGKKSDTRPSNKRKDDQHPAKAKELNAMNLKDLITLKLHVLLFS